MKFFLTILLILTAQLCFPQSLDELKEKAFDHSRSKRYDSALKYFLQLKQHYPFFRESFINSKIADSYLELGNVRKAEKYYLYCLSIDKNNDSFGLSQSFACRALS